MGRRWWLTTWALALGCFSEATSPASEGGSTGATMQCPLGTRGCPCDGLACDAGLACHGPSHMCYEPDCDRGALDCPCAEGLCLTGLECIDDFCVEPDVGPASTTTATTGPDPMTASASDPTTATESSTGVEPADTGTGDPTAVGTTGDPVDPCLSCLAADQICACDDACEVVAQCVLRGMDLGFCCANGPPEHADSWDAFVACALSEGCANACGGAPPDCVGG